MNKISWNNKLVFSNHDMLDDVIQFLTTINQVEFAIQIESLIGSKKRIKLLKESLSILEHTTNQVKIVTPYVDYLNNGLGDHLRHMPLYRLDEKSLQVLNEFDDIIDETTFYKQKNLISFCIKHEKALILYLNDFHCRAFEKKYSLKSNHFEIIHYVS